VVKGGSFREQEDWARITWWGFQLRSVEGGLGSRTESVYEENVRSEAADQRQFDLGFRCVMPARPFLEQALARLSELPSAQAKRAREELLVLGEHLGALAGEADQKQRLLFRHNLPETRLTTIRSLFPLDREDGNGQDLVLLLESGRLERFDPHGELRFALEVCPSLVPDTSVRGLTAVVPGPRRIAVSFTARGPGGQLVGLSLIDSVEGKVLRRCVWPGNTIEIWPSSNAILALVVADRFWAPLAQLAAQLGQLAAHWYDDVIPAWARASQRYAGVTPNGSLLWQWAWRASRAFEDVREEQDLGVAGFEGGRELPIHRSLLYLVDAGDGAVMARASAGGALERLADAGAPPPGLAQAWMVRGHGNGELLRIERTGQGLTLTDLGRGTGRDRTALAVPSATPGEQGSLILLGPGADDVRVHLVGVSAQGIDERWSLALPSIGRDLRDVQLVMPGVLAIADSSDRTWLVNAADGLAREPGLFGGPTVTARMKGQVWLSALEARSVVLSRVDRPAPERRLRIDTLGSHQAVFDRSGQADLTLALIQSDAVFASEGVLSGYEMDLRSRPLDALLEDFRQAEARGHEAR
jgi:hypothetical protein